MTKFYRISQVYDIADAFISDKNSKIAVTKNDNVVKYCITRKINKHTTYTMNIIQPIGDVIKPQPGVRDWEINYKLGTVELKANNERLLLAQTRHSVGKAETRNSSDLQKWFARAKSRKFFNVVELANKRLRGELSLTDNATTIFNIVFKLKEMQK